MDILTWSLLRQGGGGGGGDVVKQWMEKMDRLAAVDDIGEDIILVVVEVIMPWVCLCV